MNASFLRKLRGRSLAELHERTVQFARRELEARGLAGDIREPTESELRAALVPGFRDVNIGAHLLSRTSPRFIAGVRDGTAAAAMRTSGWSRERDALLVAADRILAGEYDLLGFTGLSFGSPIEWNFDPVARIRVPAAHWSRVPFLDASASGDHKVIWELNRHQHFMVLGRAWQVSGREEYAECVAAQLVAWMDDNPPKAGVNWASSLEVAYRAIAWIWALELLREATPLTPAIAQRMLKFLMVSARHLEHNLSTYFSPNTHLTGEALGLVYIGTMFPELSRAAHWRTRGWKILETELERQVYPDGVYFEQASYYQWYTVDIFIHAALVSELAGVRPTPAFSNRLAAAADHLGCLVRADGTIPLIGDDDGGRLVALESRERNDVQATLIGASMLLGRPLAAREARREEVLWLFGPAAAETAVRVAPRDKSRVFGNGGYVVMRSGAADREMHAVFDRGPLGIMNCGHAHSDALSLVASAGGCPILVDPGTYTYTVSLEDRRHFRHSAAHNTITIDGASSSEPAGPFTWSSRADAKAGGDWEGGGAEYYRGSTPGFERLADPVRHERGVLFARGEYWLIHDRIQSHGAHEATAHFHFAPGASITRRDARQFDIAVPCATGVLEVVFVIAGDVDSVERDEDWVSPAYGERTLAPRIRVVSRGDGVRHLAAVVAPVSGPTVRVREEVVKQGRTIVVTRPAMEDSIMIAGGDSGEVQFHRRDVASGSVFHAVISAGIPDAGGTGGAGN